MERKFHGNESSISGLLAAGNESVVEQKVPHLLVLGLMVRLRVRERVSVRVRIRDRMPMFAVAPLKLHVSPTFHIMTPFCNSRPLQPFAMAA